MSVNGKGEDDVAAGEADPTHLPIGIAINKMSKVYKKSCRREHVGVENLSVNFYRGQITALLGQNGAGKTTTMNMLTGYYPPSSGTAYLEGRDIITDVSSIRRDLGICPQQDVLFEFMTVYEHMDMFVNLKSNNSKKKNKEEIRSMLTSSGLVDCRHVLVSKLSGGQRRRLCVVLAFIGGSRVIILDEPTSGVDPSARRAIWDLIVKFREDRTIVLCTHHLDEADILGDRVVVLHQGKMVCAGSPLYLKTHYGSGYHLTLSKEQSSLNKEQMEKQGAIPRNMANSTEILRFIQKYVSDAYISEEIGTELSIILPTDRGQSAQFPHLFSQLDSQLPALHVSSYGISDSTLEEIFLKLVHQKSNNLPIDEKSLRKLNWKGLNDKDFDKDSGLGDHDSTLRASSMTSSSKTFVQSEPGTNSANPQGRLTTKNRVTGCGLGLYQFGALFAKRFHHHKRDLKSYFSQIILPVAFICVAMGCTLIKPNGDDLPSVMMTPAIYGEDAKMFFRTQDDLTWNDAYINTMLHKPGISTTCMEGSKFIDDCTSALDPTFHSQSITGQKSKYENPEDCECTDGRQVCPEGAGGIPQPRMKTQANNYVYNITGSRFTTEDYLLRTFLDNVQIRYGGWTFDQDDGTPKATVHFFNKGWHSMPAFYNALSNMVLRANVNNKSMSEYGISTYNHPLKFSKEQLSEQIFIQGIAETGIALTILCAFCFVPAGYTIYLIHERATKEKRLQFVYGVGLATYWFTALVWDMMAYLFTVGLAIGVTAGFGISVYTAHLNLAAMAVSLILFGWATIPLMYLFVKRFTSPSSGYMIMFLMNLLTGITTTTTVFLLSLFLYVKKIKTAYNILSSVFLIFPQYCLGDALIRMSRNQFMADINDRFNVDSYVNPFTFEMLNWHFVAMAIQGLIFFILNLIVESRPCEKAKHSDLAVSAVQSGLDGVSRRKMDPSYKEDEDVSLERQRVMTGEAREDLLVLYNLKKMFKKGFKDVTAVDNVTLGIPRGECFGLLGVNGAGKTTTFHMITGEVTPTAGASLLDGTIISENLPKMDQKVGYCPQSDALDQNLTVREILYCYGKLKGLTANGLSMVVNSVMSKLDLQSYANRTVQNLSGGTRRKLSTAVALLGEPDVVLMDEPTTGMDPQTRRLAWNAITRVIRDNRSVILTSHSMEECEALCTRLAIMVNGRLMCLGNRQHLKHRFGSGYTVIVKVTPNISDLTPVVNYITSTFEGAKVKDHHLNMLEFEIPHNIARLSDIFRNLEEAKSTLNIQDYSVSQTSLDQVFINFARRQHDGTCDDEAGPSSGPDHNIPVNIESGYVNPSYDTWGARLGTKPIPVDTIDQDTMVVRL